MTNSERQNTFALANAQQSGYAQRQRRAAAGLRLATTTRRADKLQTWRPLLPVPLSATLNTADKLAWTDASESPLCHIRYWIRHRPIRAVRGRQLTPRPCHPSLASPDAAGAGISPDRVPRGSRLERGYFRSALLHLPSTYDSPAFFPFSILDPLPHLAPWTPRAAPLKSGGRRSRSRWSCRLGDRTRS
jgi:hypothetical protein